MCVVLFCCVFVVVGVLGLVLVLFGCGLCFSCVFLFDVLLFVVCLFVLVWVIVFVFVYVW